MEDTPSNYNLLNGRLDEDSTGPHKMLRYFYKSGMLVTQKTKPEE